MLLHVSARLVDWNRGLTFSRDGSVTSDDHPPPGAWTIGDPDSLFRLEDLAAVSGCKLDVSPPRQFLQAALAVGSLKSIPFKWMMPPAVYGEYLRRLRDESWDLLDAGVMEYYSSCFVSTRRLLRGLQPTAIDRRIFDGHVRDGLSTGQLAILQSFRPDDSGFAAAVRYNQCGSRTGRLTGRSGPQILRLRKDLRDVIASRFDGGTIYQLDFVSLEARIAAAVGDMEPERDIYTHLAKEIFSDRYTRSAVKLACLSVIYGAGRKRIANQLGIGLVDAEKIAGAISDAFNVREVSRGLLEEAVATGAITNRFGRKIIATDKSSHVLYNNYIQSTGVDVAMHGFGKLVDIVGSSGIAPLFVLHDAIILDVDPKREADILALGNSPIAIAGFSVPFYVDAEKF